jgi:hypothetical protein
MVISIGKSDIGNKREPNNVSAPPDISAMPIAHHNPGLLATIIPAEMLNNPLTSQYIPMKLKNDLTALSGIKNKDIPNARAMIPRTSVIHQYLTANERRSAFVLDCDIDIH